jgi:hypothetical protein
VSRDRRLTEELGWLKVAVGATVAVEGSIISWLSAATSLALGLSLSVLLLVVTIGLVLLVRQIYRLLAELERL